MHLISSVAALAVLPSVLCASSSSVAQLRLSPSPSDPSINVDEARVSLNPIEANAVLAHYLGVSGYEHLPVTNNKQWQHAIEAGDGSPAGQKIVIVLECPKDGCKDFIPSQLADSTAFDLPSLPVHSWTAAIALHAHRLAESLGINKDSPLIVGLDSFVHGLKSIDGWAGWIRDELGQRIGWDGVKNTVKAAVIEPIRHSVGAGPITDADLLQHESTATLITEMESLSSLSDSLASSSTASDASAQTSAPQIVTLHIKGMKAIGEALGPSSETYQRAATLLRASLDATLSALERAAPGSSQDEQSTVVLLTLPPYSPPLIRKRAKWLKPFQPSYSQYAAKQAHSRPRSVNVAGHIKRSTVFSPGMKSKRAEGDENDKRRKQPIVPTSRRCFASLDELKNLTANCLGHGVGLKGISTQKLPDGQSECWVCSCGRAKDDKGKERTWGGEGCEKIDLSGDFVLLFFSGVGLLAIAVVSVLFLYRVGQEELPGTLSSVSGNGLAGAKRD